MKILVINPGSTSTKYSLYEDDKDLITKSIYHDADVLKEFKNTNEQSEFRKKLILEDLINNGFHLIDIDAFVGRGGSAYSQEEGVIEIDEKLYEDTLKGVGGSIHPARLGVIIAYELAIKFSKPSYTLNATNLDELQDVARITGIKGVYRYASCHALNQKAVSRKYAKSINKDYEDLNLIVCHIDGGITITAHQKGKMIDSNIGSGGDGPFSPTRVGSIAVTSIIDYLKEHTVEELEDMTSKTGGFVSYFGTSNGDKVRELIKQGDVTAKLVWDAMIYNIVKEIGAMSAVLKCKVDAIILTGGYIRFDDLVKKIKEYCLYIAPITCIKDIEQETLALETLKVLNGVKSAHKYTGEPVFKGFKGIDF